MEPESYAIQLHNNYEPRGLTKSERIAELQHHTSRAYERGRDRLEAYGFHDLEAVNELSPLFLTRQARLVEIVFPKKDGSRQIPSELSDVVQSVRDNAVVAAALGTRTTSF